MTPASELQAARGHAERDFRDIPNEYRLRMHWYVFGPDVPDRSG